MGGFAIKTDKVSPPPMAQNSPRNLLRRVASLGASLICNSDEGSFGINSKSCFYFDAFLVYPSQSHLPFHPFSSYHFLSPRECVPSIQAPPPHSFIPRSLPTDIPKAFFSQRIERSFQMAIRNFLLPCPAFSFPSEATFFRPLPLMEKVRNCQRQT